MPGFYSIETTFAAMRSALGLGLDIRVFECPHTSQGWLRKLRNFIAARSQRADVSHILGDVHYLALATPAASTVLTVHDCGFALTGNWLRRSLLRLLWVDLPVRRVARVTAISEKTKAEILSLVAVPPAKIAVIPDCIPAVFQPFSRVFHAAKPVVLQVGTLPNKNVPRLIAALHGLSCELHLVGRVTPEIRAALDAYPVDCRFSQNLSQSDLAAAYANADIVAFVSTYEGFGMPVIEGQAVGRPVLTSAIEPLLTVSGGAAAFADPLSVASIRAQLERLFSDAPWRESLVAQGFQNARKYSAESVAAQYRRLYEELGAAQNH